MGIPTEFAVLPAKHLIRRCSVSNLTMPRYPARPRKLKDRAPELPPMDVHAMGGGAMRAAAVVTSTRRSFPASSSINGGQQNTRETSDDSRRPWEEALASRRARSRLCGHHHRRWAPPNDGNPPGAQTEGRVRAIQRPRTVASTLKQNEASCSRARQRDPHRQEALQGTSPAEHRREFAAHVRRKRLVAI